MLEKVLIGLVSKLGQSLFEFIFSLIIELVDIQKDNRDIDEALNEEDRRKAATDLDAIYNS